jgi:sec-independent protein translocase protein TatC
MADDLFEDSTMTFGEHIEELRVHLIRALKWLLLVMVVMIFFGNYVVKIITQPVESQMETFLTKQMNRRAAELENAAANVPGAKDILTMKVKLPAAELARLSVLNGGEAPAGLEDMEIEVQTPVAPVVKALAVPLAWLNGRFRLKTLSAQEGFMIYFKAVLGASIVVASPLLFWELYSFIAVGLYAHERRFVNLTLPFCLVLFLTGVAVCYFLVFPAMLRFFLYTNEQMDLEPDFRLNEWVGFAVILMVIFGAVFQMPVLMLTLERVGIISYEMLAPKRKLAVFINCIVAAAISPGGDPNTMIFLALPMCLLFELGLFLMRYFRKRNPFEVPEPVAEGF